MDSLDRSHSTSEPAFGPAEESEAKSGYSDTQDHATPEAKRAGYGYATVPGGQGHPMGGHNMDAKNQYTVKVKRGSSL